MITGQREIEKYQVLNLIEIKTEDDRIINLLKKQKIVFFALRLLDYSSVASKQFKYLLLVMD